MPLQQGWGILMLVSCGGFEAISWSYYGSRGELGADVVSPSRSQDEAYTRYRTARQC